jgi:cystathionine beta-lyase
MYNFDEIIDRQNTDCVKYERCMELFGTTDLTPLWVADMDFRTPDFIIDAIRKRLEHPILGYTMPQKNFAEITRQWISSHHSWNVKCEWLGFLPGIVPGLAFAVQTYTSAGDEVIVQPPVYYPFFNVVKNNGRTLVYNQLKEENGKFVMNLADFERKITERTKLLILCNPHNPGGRVWTRGELLALAEVCKRHDINVISDEIHADMVLPSSATLHTPFVAINEWTENHTVTFMSPTKVFNMPGLISSCYIIPNRDLRLQFAHCLEASEMMGGNIFAYIGTAAAYTNGEEWRLQMLAYVQENINFLEKFLRKNIPAIAPMLPEASFLVWLDCKGLGMDTNELHRFFSLKAHLGLNKGTIFGAGGENHLRLNVACPRSVLKQTLEQLKNAIEQENIPV